MRGKKTTQLSKWRGLYALSKGKNEVCLRLRGIQFGLRWQGGKRRTAVIPLEKNTISTKPQRNVDEKEGVPPRLGGGGKEKKRGCSSQERRREGGKNHRKGGREERSRVERKKVHPFPLTNSLLRGETGGARERKGEIQKSLGFGGGGLFSAPQKEGCRAGGKRKSQNL